MTEVLSRHSKKRKHRTVEEHEPTVNAPQKRKEKRRKPTPQSVASTPHDASSQKPKPKKSLKDKGKSRASDLSNEFCVVNASIVLSVPPVFASNLRAGVEEMLDSMVMRYIPSLQGVLLAHSNIRFLRQTASIHGDCPFAVCNVSFDASVWGPRVSMKLVGKINVCSPDHISLLVHRTFNVSIPRHHIPQDQWLFEYGPAENDPEFGEGRICDTSDEPNGAANDGGDVEIDGSIELKASGESREAESSGRWVHHLTGVKLGYPNGNVEFTVIGLTVANEMLSLQGSIQPDPFSPEHVPHPEKSPSSPAFCWDETSEVQSRHAATDEEEKDEESDEDGFKHLARLTDEAQASQKAKRAQEEAERLREPKKRKRREERDGADRLPDDGKRTKRKRTKEIAL